MKIGERIKHRREELGMSQDDLARKLGYKSRSSINKIERDASGLPQKKIRDIAIALNTTPSYIMGWEEEEKKNNDIANIIVRLRSDEDFFDSVSIMYQLDDEKLKSVNNLLLTFLK